MRYVSRQPLPPSRRLIAAAACGAALAIGVGPALAQTPPAAVAKPSSIKTLDRAQIDTLLAGPAKVLVIDVRRPDEISSIGGFPVFLSVQNADLGRSLAYVPRDRQIITVSNHAHRAVQAAEVLKSKGYRIAGAAGVQDYEAQGGTLVGKKSAAPNEPRPAGPSDGATLPQTGGR